MTEMPKITQEMINLYDEYTHITLDRRAYMRKLTALVGSTATAAAVTGLIAGDKAKAQIVKADDTRIKGSMVKYPGEGGEMRGLPLHAGQRDRQAADRDRDPREPRPHRPYPGRDAAHGARRLPGVRSRFPQPVGRHAGRRGPRPRDPRKLDRPRAIANAVATVKFLKAHASSNGKVGATGFCWGGGMVNALATAAGADLLAAAPYYGIQPPADQVAKIKARMLLHYAQNDDNINKGIAAYKEALDKAGGEVRAASPTKARSTPSTTTARRRATTRRRPISPGSARSTCSRQRSRKID